MMGNFVPPMMMGGSPPPTQQMLAAALGCVMQMMQQNRVDPRIINFAQQAINSDANYQQAFIQETTRILNTPGMMDHAGGVNAQAFCQAIYPWTHQLVATIYQVMQQQMQPMMGGGFAAPMGGGGLLGQPMATLGGGSGYDDHHAPQPPIAPVSQPQPTQSAPPAQEPTMTTAVAQPQPIAHLDFRTLEFEERLGNGITKRTYEVAEYQRGRVAWISVDVEDRAAHKIDIVRRLITRLPTEAMRGQFVIHANWHQLVAIPEVSTDAFLKLRDQVKAAMNNSGWRDALIWPNISHRHGKLIEQVVVSEINRYLKRVLRRSTALSEMLWIQSISDLDELTDVEFKHPITSEGRYDRVVKDIINTVIKNIFVDESAVADAGNGLGDVIQCEGIPWYKNGMTKYDIASPNISETDRKQAVAEMLAAGTVLRLPRSMVFTNAIDPGALGMLDMKYQAVVRDGRTVYQPTSSDAGIHIPVPLDNTGLFGAIVRDRKDFRETDDVVARMPGIPPQQFLTNGMMVQSLDGSAFAIQRDATDSIYW